MTNNLRLFFKGSYIFYFLKEKKKDRGAQSGSEARSFSIQCSRVQCFTTTKGSDMVMIVLGKGQG